MVAAPDVFMVFSLLFSHRLTLIKQIAAAVHYKQATKIMMACCQKSSAIPTQQQSLSTS
jgi:hypothetical protein